jgi:hypothetical protein
METSIGAAHKEFFPAEIGDFLANGPLIARKRALVDS